MAHSGLTGYWAHRRGPRGWQSQRANTVQSLYPVKLFKLLHFHNLWLSPTPDKPSKGWDAGSERILTVGVFEHRTTSQRIAVFNTHLDNAGCRARKESVVIILETIAKIREQWSVRNNLGEHCPLPYLLAGDFNSFPSQETYRALAASGTMVDTYTAVRDGQRYGSEMTFTGFQPDTDEDEDEKGRIDFVWFGPQEASKTAPSSSLPLDAPIWDIQGYSVLPNVFDDGVFASDHRAVVADAMLSITHQATAT
ncbi:hypothetical protein LTR62_002952 [Meristemomyces frigidus]|uniref:Endonuclease/exonuclease/phosphatase domain-containing protein n=1 Tax=Meristemomyces frigidus TaxID=1508187 RepID=A0AAN7TRT5_9PEZI|nr:hypothetical protein LTR62_002952 [Meristemomyces frigidus]